MTSVTELDSETGGGLLVDMMKRATQTKQYAELDHALRTKVEPYLYNKGKGKWIPIEKLVLLRNKDRPKHKMVKNRPCDKHKNKRYVNFTYYSFHR